MIKTIKHNLKPEKDASFIIDPLLYWEKTEKPTTRFLQKTKKKSTKELGHKKVEELEESKLLSIQNAL